MAKRGDPDVLRLLVIFLRSHANRTQAQFGKECGLGQAQVSRFEQGDQAPPEDALRRMAKVAGIDWPLVVHLHQFYRSLLGAVRSNAAPAAWDPDRAVNEAVESVKLAMAPYLVELRTWKPAPPSPEEEQREAEKIWKALERYPVPARRRMIEMSPRSGNWALALQACEASAKSAAARQAEEALALAEMALGIAKRAPGDESWRSRLEGYAWAHVAHARRAAGNPAGVRDALARARELWRAGGSPVPPSKSSPGAPASLPARLTKAK